MWPAVHIIMLSDVENVKGTSLSAPNPTCYVLIFSGGLQAHLLHVHEGWAAQSMEGELCHHGEGHALRRHPVLLARTVQKTTGELLRLPGKVSRDFAFQLSAPSCPSAASGRL